jgi:competence protein ComEC
MHPYEIPIWKQAPFIRLLIPFVVGILWEWYVPMNTIVIFTGGVCCLICLLLFSRLPVFVRYRHAYAEGIFLFLFFLFFAAWLLQQQDLRRRSEWYGHFAGENSTYLMTIREPLIEKQNSYSTIASVDVVFDKSGYKNTIGNIQVYLKKSETTAALHYGDRIQSNASPQNIRNFGNPGEFDKKRYQFFQQIYQQVYLDDEHYQLLSSGNGISVHEAIYFFRDEILKILKKHITESNGQLGIAEALLIGYRNDLDSELLNAYANTGVVHIIAISGLHLGLIYAVLVWLLSVIPLVKQSKIIQAVVVILFLWTFSLMTGASASVMRSAVMFTVIIIGKTINRNTSVYNALAASAFLLLCYNPYYLWDVGFQLSYLAIVGIVWLQKPIQRKWLPENKWLFKIWEMVSITIAAQIFTFPICLYYFHQFPNYFLPVNLVAVPLSTLILFAEILLLLMSPIQPIAHGLGWCIGKGILCMNGIVGFFNNLPLSKITNVYADTYTTLLLYLFIIFLIFFLFLKKYGFLFGALLIFLIFYFLIFTSHIKFSNQNKLIIYNIPHHFSIDWMNGKNTINVSDSGLVVDQKGMNYFLKGGRHAHGAHQTTVKQMALAKQNYLIHFGTLKILYCSDPELSVSEKKAQHPDLIILHGDANFKLPEWLHRFHPKRIIFSSNSLWKIAKWKKECEDLALPCFSIPEQGAFIVDVNHFQSEEP